MTTYKQELLSLEGVGEKTAQKIMELYPSRDDLLLAVHNGEELPFAPELCVKLKEHALLNPKVSSIIKDSVELFCSVPNIMIVRQFNPRIRIKIGETGIIKVKPEVAEYLLKDSRFKKTQGGE